MDAREHDSSFAFFAVFAFIIGCGDAASISPRQADQHRWLAIGRKSKP